MSQATLGPEPYRNSNLFSGYYLEERVDDLDEWECDDEAREAFERLRELWELESDLLPAYKEDELLGAWIDEVVEILGFGTIEEATLPDGGGYVDRLLFESDAERRTAAERKLKDDPEGMFSRAGAVLEAKQWGADFEQRYNEDRSYRDASHQVKYYLERTPSDVKWGILTDGKKWRLYGTKDYETQTYYEVDLPEILESGDLTAFKYFYLFFRPEAFVEGASGSFLDRVWNESETAAQNLGEDLQDNVFTALRILGKGFVESNDLDIDPDDEAARDELKEQSLVLLYRLMFVLYAESRGLIDPDDPAASEEYRENFSLDEIRQEIVDEVEGKDVESGAAFHDEYSEFSTTIWNRLTRLFELIDEGEERLDIPPYNGGLFDRDDHEFLADNDVADPYIAEVIYRLSTTENADGDHVLADYADLDTRHLGSIYEGLLEHEFRIAPAEGMAAVSEDGGQVWKPGDEVSVAEAVETVDAGGLYVVNDEGERKATGAYYTPDYVVTYIVEETVDPLIEEIHADLEADGLERSDREYFRRFYQRVRELTVLDPAMGSGHFLTKATGYLTEQVMEVVREQEIQSYDEQELRREISKECIYGVDLNGMAVELAKLSMWLETLAADQPLAFLDHHLKDGNSLVGSDVTEVLSEDDGDADDGQLTLTQALTKVRRDTLEHVMELMADLLSYDNETLADVKSMEELYDEIRDDPLYGRLFELANVHTAEQFGVDVPSDAYERMAGAIENEADWAEIEGQGWFEDAQAVADEQNFFHWELEYPEVFFDSDGGKLESGGFDAVVGNPPYMRIQTIRLQNESQVEYFNDLYRSSHQNYDIYALFAEKAYNIISNRGQVGYILPHKFTNAEFGEGLRDLLTEKSCIRKMVDFGHTQIFDQAATYTCLLFLSKSHNESMKYTVSDRELLESNLSWSDIDLSDLGSDSWILLGPNEMQVINKIEDTKSLKEISESVFVGIQTSKDSVYALDTIADNGESLRLYSKELDHEVELSKEMVVPYLKGKDVGRYEKPEPNKHLIFPYNITDDGYSLMSPSEIQSKCQSTWEYLKQNREILEGRDGGKMEGDGWYGYTYPKSLHRHTKPKVITPEIAEECSFTIDKEGNYSTSVIYSVAVDNEELSPEYILGILNSKTTWYYVSNTSHVLRGGFYRFKSGYLRPIGIPRPSDLHNISDIIERSEVVDAGGYSSRNEDVQDLMEQLVSSQLEHTEKRDNLNLSLQDYLRGAGFDNKLSSRGLHQPVSEDSGILVHTKEENPNLRIGTARVERESPNTVLITATARYKPDDEDAHETDQWGYTETEYLPAFRITDLTETEADLIEHFVPVAVDEAGGFANFRETATKTNSLIDRLKAIELPDPDAVADDLDNYLRTVERAEELDEKIEKTDDLIDEIVYDLYGLTDEEIEIVEEAVN